MEQQSKSTIKKLILYVISAAVVYLVFAGIYMRQLRFEQTWLLYLGNLIFGVVITIYLLRFNAHRAERASVYGMVKAGHILTAISTVTAVVGLVILLFATGTIDIADNFETAALQHAPAQMDNDQSNHLLFVLFFDAVIGNISAGSFVSILFPFALTKMQRGEKEPSGNLR